MQRRELLAKEGAICSAFCRERELRAGSAEKVNYLQKDGAMHFAGIESNLQEVQGTICKEGSY